MALFNTASGSDNNDLLEARFKELDINTDKEVNLPEFLYGMSYWVGHMDEDEDDE